MFKRLLTKEVTDFHPIFEAISHGKIGWIKSAKDYVHTRSIQNDTPLLIAVKTAWNNDSITLHLKLMKVIRLLIEYGADVNAQDIHGQTVLMAAAGKYKLRPAMKMLLPHSDIRSNKGKTYWEYCCEENRIIAPKKLY